MFSSRRQSLRQEDVSSGETLFEFLKRKKKVSIEDSIQKSKPIGNDSSLSHIELNDEDTERITTTNKNTNRKHASSHITPKKVTFLESETKQTACTFIDMISPLKQRNSNSKEMSFQISTERAPEKSNRKSTNDDTFTRKQFNNSVNIMRETIQNFIQAGKNLKQKSHSLFIELRPVLKIAEEEIDNKAIKKKIESAKQKLRLMQFQFTQLDIKDSDEIITGFHKKLSEHLISVQSKYRSQFEKSEMESVNKIKYQKDSEIRQLSQQNLKYQRQIEGLQKNIEKLEKSLDGRKNQSEQRLSSFQQNSQRRLLEMQNELSRTKQTNMELIEELAKTQKQVMQKDKKLKDALYAKQQIAKRMSEQNSAAKSARQQFLLNQLMILKEEFKSDIKQLTDLYSSKQKDHIIIIQEQKQQLQQLKSNLSILKQADNRNLNDSENMKNLMNKYRKQNQCLVTDMHRMNEQLYQHWLALKDIKTLASRLQILPKFSRIYQDLAFNDLLFS